MVENETRNFNKNDFNWVASLHIRLMPNDLSSCLGENFLKSVIYPVYLDSGLSKVIPYKGAILVLCGLHLSLIRCFWYVLKKPTCWIKIFEYFYRKRECAVDLSAASEFGYIFAEHGHGSIKVWTLNRYRVFMLSLIQLLKIMKKTIL